MANGFLIILTQKNKQCPLEGHGCLYPLEIVEFMRPGVKVLGYKESIVLLAVQSVLNDYSSAR